DSMSTRDLLVVAGEASGDLHAARVLEALRTRRPGQRAFGLGSTALRAAGLETVADSREISVVGITEALTVLTRAREIFDRLLVEAERRRPAAALLVDFPEFNLRLARELAWRRIPVVYYVSPQIWAWRRGRVRAIRDTVDRMLVLFDFEEAFYRRHGVAVRHVGHPLVDEVPRLPQAWESVPARRLPGHFRLALLPGSRPSEVDALLPLQLAAAKRLAAELPLSACVVCAPSIERGYVEAIVARSGFEVEIVEEERHEAVAASHLALCASGTATLETGLLGTPLVVLYRLSKWTWRLARLLVRVPHASLVNLVLGRPVVPELLQEAAEPENVAREVKRLLSSRRDIDRMRAELATLRPRLGRPGASERAADELLAYLEPQEKSA
ncbi:MAG: lipid-A-disaccharide synthase, partial [Myxococcota bacterium]